MTSENDRLCVYFVVFKNGIPTWGYVLHWGCGNRWVWIIVVDQEWRGSVWCEVGFIAVSGTCSGSFFGLMFRGMRQMMAWVPPDLMQDLSGFLIDQLSCILVWNVWRDGLKAGCHVHTPVWYMYLDGLPRRRAVQGIRLLGISTSTTGSAASGMLLTSRLPPWLASSHRLTTDTFGRFIYMTDWPGGQSLYTCTVWRSHEPNHLSDGQ